MKEGKIGEINNNEDEPGGNYEIATLDRKNRKKRTYWFIESIEELKDFLELREEDIPLLKRVSSLYPMRIPLYYLSLIHNPLNENDPIRRQCIPSKEELEDGLFENLDPLGEEKTSPLSFLVHRYPDRVLLIVTSRCFIYCRHCTRKRLWSQDKEPTLKDIEEGFSYIRENPQIREVIVSGGDPFTLSNHQIKYILDSLSQLKNIEVIRIGTRAPVVFPQRINYELCGILKKYKNLWINTQFNHPREITPQAEEACRRLQNCGIPLSNQSVLLKGVNDDPSVMKELCQKLQSIRVRPYYLFQCDPVVGAGHFRTSVKKGIEIIEKMRGFTSGMCVPTFVVDGLDGKGKVPLSGDYLVSYSPEGLILRNYKNEIFFYPEPKKTSPLSKKNKVKTIGIIFNLKKDRFSDEEEEYDEISTIESISKELEKFGFAVKFFEHNIDLVDRLKKEKPDFILNIAEGISRKRNRESEVPILLEMLGIPYSGSDSLSLGLTLDKYLCNNFLKSKNIPVPLMFKVDTTDSLESLGNIFGEIKFFLVKPRWEGSSKGIFLNSLVDNWEDLYERVKHIISHYNQPALIEEFLPGEEITVGVGGNNKPKILGMMRITPQEKTDNFIYSLEVKRNWQSKVKYEPEDTISLSLREKIRSYAIKAYEFLELRDFVRIDFRVNSCGIPCIIDINPLPGLSPSYSDLPIMYYLQGKTYSRLLKELLEDSFLRWGLDF